MDGSFACPECGSSVEVAGLAPGRQVRCGFCNRLLEVPYLPRAAESAWKRRRFARPRWFVWACVALGLVSVASLGTGTFALSLASMTRPSSARSIGFSTRRSSTRPSAVSTRP